MEINGWFEIYFMNKIDRAGKWIRCEEYLRKVIIMTPPPSLIFSIKELGQ